MNMLCSFTLLVSFILPLALFAEVPDHNHEVCDETTCTSKVVSCLEFFNSLMTEARGTIEDLQTQSCGSLCAPIDCSALMNHNHSSGVYTIRPRSRVVDRPIQVFCDMDDGGGWTVIQRRGDFNSSLDYFYRNWSSYKTGFGDLEKDFWIGNDILYSLTNQRSYSLKIVLSDFEGTTAYATYDEFWIEDESNNYKLRVNGYRGDAGDSFASSHDGAPFTTRDRKNNANEQNCAELYKGAWWYVNCHMSNLNGQYLRGPHKTYADGVNWKTFKGYNYSLKDTVMKIRPRSYRT